MLQKKIKPIVQEMLAAKVGDDESTRSANLVKIVPLSKKERGERTGG